MVLQVASLLPKMLHDSNAAALGAAVHVLDRFVKVTPVGPDSELNDVMDAVIERAMASKPSVQQTALEAMVELTVRSAHNGGGGSAVLEGGALLQQVPTGARRS